MTSTPSLSTPLKISQGAEAVIYLDKNTIIKHRFKKSYRHPSLDFSLRKSRTRREAKVLQVLEKMSIRGPRPISIDDKEMRIVMQHIDGKMLSAVLKKNPLEYGKKIGGLVAKLHTADIIHGDLTTSNMMVENDELGCIDFGLSFFSKKIEDKSVEIHLLHKALESRHPEVAELVFEKCIEEYVKEFSDGTKVKERLESSVEMRGRNKRK